MKFPDLIRFLDAEIFGRIEKIFEVIQRILFNIIPVKFSSIDLRNIDLTV